MKRILTALLLLITGATVNAQVGFGTTTPDPSAAVDIYDTTRGLLIPRMDMAHRNAIVNPATGLMVYQTDSTQGFWYFDGSLWKNIHAGNEGKRIIVLTDNITNSQAQAQIAAELGPNTEEIAIKNCSNLTAVDFSGCTNLKTITISENPLLGSVNFGNLKILEGNLYIGYCPALTTINLPLLERITAINSPPNNAVYISYSGLTAFNCPKLKRIGGSAWIDYNPALASISLPLLTDMGWLYVYYNPLITTVSAPVLKKMGGFQFLTNDKLSVVSFPSVTELTISGNCQIRESPLLSSFLLGNLTTFKNYEFSITACKLSSANINSLLHSFTTIVPAPVNAIRFFVAGMTPPAPPTGQGIIDKNALLANGNQVVTD